MSSSDSESAVSLTNDDLLRYVSPDEQNNDGSGSDIDVEDGRVENDSDDDFQPGDNTDNTTSDSETSDPGDDGDAGAVGVTGCSSSQWSNDDFLTEIRLFDAYRGPPHPQVNCQSPFDYFSLVFPLEAYNIMARETNLYARQLLLASGVSEERLHMSLMDCVNNTNVSTTFLEKCPEATRGAPPPLHQDATVDLPKYPALNIPSGSRKETGMPCAAKYEEDSQWYRAEVRSYTLRDVDVFFVDYGNTQSSPNTSVFMLEPEFVSCLEALALHCQLRVLESKNAKAQYDQFNDWTEDQELEMVVKGKEGSKLLVDLLKKGVSLTEELTGWHRVKAAMEKLPSCYTPGKVSPGQTVSAFASFIESPARFWVQLAGCDDELTSLVRILSGHYSSGSEPTLSSPSPGQPCVALYELDEQWYRASVISIHGTQIKVQFVDYGNTELVDRQNVKSISPGFLSAPLLAVECCLDGFQSCAMAEDDVAFMESLVSSQELSVTFRGPKNVLVRVGDMDIAQALQDKGLGPQQQKASQAQSLSQSSSRVSSPPSGGSPHLSQSGYSPTGPLLKFKEAVPPSGSAEGIISHVDEESGMIYVQLLSSESQLQQLSSKLQSSFGSGGSPLQGSPVTGMACCAKFCMDQCWYRAVVEQVKGAQVQVQFVDYGNSDTVSMSTLKSATPDLMNSPKHAFVCKLKGLKAWTAHTYKALCRCGLDQQLNVRFVTSSSPFEIQASANGQDLLQMMFKPPVPSPQVSPPKASFDSRSDHRDSRNSRQAGPQPTRQNGFGNTGQSYNKRPGQQSYGSTQAEEDSWIEAKPSNKAQSASPESPVQTVEQVFQPQVVPAGEQAAYISNVAEDGTFAVQLVTDITAVDEMTSKVENCPLLRHPSPIVGAACGAQYSADRAWYRGIILSVSGASAHVVFVDYGNEEMCQLNALKPLPAHLLTPPLAYHCQVGGIIPTAEQREALRLAGEKALFFTFREGTCNPYDVSVRDENGTSLIETILRPTAISQPTVPSKMVHATVCHVGQDGHFYLQLNSELDAIDDFRFDIQTVCETHTEKLTSFDDGQFCFAQFSEDDAWYRAVIISSSGDKATVLFVDYGNTDIADKDGLFVIPPSFMIKPAYAYDCRIPGVKKWKEGQKQKFEAMTEDKMMNARFLTSEPPYEVQLTRDIGLELEEEAETTENEKLANEPAENVELIKNEESPEEPAKHFKLAEETASGELVEDAGRPTEMVQEPSEDAEQFYNVEEGTEEVEASGRDPQKLAEAVVSEEEFSDVRESPESSMPGEDTGADPLKATVLEYPAQMPPALDACIVSHLNEDGTFYLQLVSEDESREKISDRLQDECESADSKTVVCPSVKHACCAKFSDDDAWYRAVIEKVADKKVEVLFVDFGNMDDIAVEDLRELSAESLQVPPLAYKCVLEDCDTELVNNKLEEATLDQTLTVTFSTTETIPYSVSLKLEDGTNISTVLTKSVEQASSFLQSADESGAAQHRVEEVCAEDRKSVALVQGQRVRVMVSDITSPSLFYVQPDNNSSALDEMSDFMFEHFSSLAEEDGTIANIAQGQLCACQFGEDGSWYRAVVRSMDSEADRCSLFYVDYGNSDCVPKASVREMPVEFKAVPWQCVSCSLAGVSCQQEWSQEVKAAFEDMLANKLVRFLRTQSGGGLAPEQDDPVDSSRRGSLLANPTQTRSRPQQAPPREETLGAGTSGHQAPRGTAKPPWGHRTFAPSCVGPHSTQVAPATRSARDLGPSASINYPQWQPRPVLVVRVLSDPLSLLITGQKGTTKFSSPAPTAGDAGPQRISNWIPQFGIRPLGGFPLGEPHSDQVQTPASSPRVETLGADTSGHQAPRGTAKPPRGHRTFAPSCVGPQSTQVAPATRSARDLGSSASIDYPLDTPGTTQASSGRHGPLRPIVPIANWTRGDDQGFLPRLDTTVCHSSARRWVLVPPTIPDFPISPLS
ncbi:hypothetical protein ACOMHN_056311 [Nucella lapillus]